MGTRRRAPGARRFETLEARTLLAADLPDPIAGLRVDSGSFDAAHILVRYREAGEIAAGPIGLETTDTGRAISSLRPSVREITARPGQDVAALVAAYRADPRIAYAEPDYTVSLEAVPNDSQFPRQWDMSNTTTPGADIGAPAAWDVTTSAGGTTVAVIDSGIDYNHRDLAANIWTNPGEIAGNGVDDDGNGYVDDIHGYDFVNNDGDPMDDQGHGTHVAGTIGAVGNNGIGTAGIAWTGVKLMALKFLNSSGAGSISGAVAALYYAVANGAAISNNSWGGTGFSQALADAIAYANDHNHIVVAAAGNSKVNNDVKPFYPASTNQPNVVAVAATDSLDRLAGFSNYGATSVDLAAPGVAILSTARGGSTKTLSGTSMATPHVAGAMALVWGLHPEWTAGQVIQQVLATVDPLPSLQGKVATGGRLDLARAVAPTGGTTTTTDTAVVAAISLESGTAVGVTGRAAGPFTVRLDGPATGTVRLTPDDGGAGGVFTPAFLDLTADHPSGSFTYVPSAAGTVSISVANNAGLSDPAPRALSVRAAGLVAATQAGRWSDPATWGGLAPPAEGDSALLDAAVILDTSLTLGTGAATALTIDGGGSLTIADGAALRLAGNVVQRNGSTVTAMGAGRIVFDTAAAGGSNLSWQIGDAYALSGFARFQVRGTPQARFRIEATGPGVGTFTNGGNKGGGWFDAEYADLARIGDATIWAVAPFLEYRACVLRLDHVVLTDCGTVGPGSWTPNTGGSLTQDSLVEIADSVFTAPAAAYSLYFHGSGQPMEAPWRVVGNDLDGLVRLRTGGFTIADNVYRQGGFIRGGAVLAATPGPFAATAYTVSGPDAGAVGEASAIFTVSLANGTTGAATIVPSDNGAGGAFSAAALSLTTDHPTATFTYTPKGAGAVLLTFTDDGALPGNNGTLIDPGPLVYVAGVPAAAASAAVPTAALADRLRRGPLRW